MPVGGMVISFDLELAWGSRRAAHGAARPTGVEKVRDVVRGLLEILVRYEISATWATVGHLMLTREDCTAGRYKYDLPTPKHQWFEGEWYDGIPPMGSEGAEAYYAPDIVEAIVTCPVCQELAAHTFSHVIVGDPGCSAAVARAEFARCRELAKAWGRQLTSFVFPRNAAGHLDVLQENGYICYRGINSEWYWLGKAEQLGTSTGTPVFRRLARCLIHPLRYLDEQLRLCPPLPPARRVGSLWEIPHSMFFPGFRGVSKYVSAKARFQKASHGMRAAAERGRIFGLYTHPHNFLVKTGLLLAAFEKICSEAARLRDGGRLEALTMGQIAAELENGRNLHWTRP